MVEGRLQEAPDLARWILGSSSERWAHTVGVAERAIGLRNVVIERDRSILVAVAWLHDIGYGAGIRDLGFHPIDGARYLTKLGWPIRVSSLVAHHSGARFVAAARGFSAFMGDHEFEDSPVMDALTYADQTTGPGGRLLSVEDRMEDMLRRHGPTSPNALAHRLRRPYLRAVAARVEIRLYNICSTANDPIR